VAYHKIRNIFQMLLTLLDCEIRRNRK